MFLKWLGINCQRGMLGIQNGGQEFKMADMMPDRTIPPQVRFRLSMSKQLERKCVFLCILPQKTEIWIQPPQNLHFLCECYELFDWQFSGSSPAGLVKPANRMLRETEPRFNCQQPYFQLNINVKHFILSITQLVKRPMRTKCLTIGIE